MGVLAQCLTSDRMGEVGGWNPPHWGCSFIQFVVWKAAGGVPQCRKWGYAGVVVVGFIVSGVRAKGLFA